MRHRHVALVDVHHAIDPDELRRVATALTTQVNDHFAPVWDVTATVGIDAKPHQHPSTIELRMDAKGAHPPGRHFKGPGGKSPSAVVYLSSLGKTWRDVWPFLASHELLEMLANPQGERTASAPHPDDETVTVDYLVEVCDPCAVQWYPIHLPKGDKVRVSDFVVREYYEPKTLGSIAKYSYTGLIKEPLDVLPTKGVPGKQKEYSSFVSFRHPHGTKWFWKVRDEKGPAFVADVPEGLVVHS